MGDFAVVGELAVVCSISICEVVRTDSVGGSVGAGWETVLGFFRDLGFLVNAEGSRALTCVLMISGAASESSVSSLLSPFKVVACSGLLAWLVGFPSSVSLGEATESELRALFLERRTGRSCSLFSEEASSGTACSGVPGVG